MVRYLVRAVVRHGHWREFLAAFAAWDEAAVREGLPRYRLYQSNWGTYGEVVAEAEYADSADIDRRIAVALRSRSYESSHEAVLSHLVDGETRDYVLVDVTP